jgi:hypothetical protein
MLDSNRLSLPSKSAHKNGIFIPLEDIKKFDEIEYIRLAKDAIEHYQNHPHQVPYRASPHLKIFNTPATAVIVGTGTVGLEAITYASRILPPQSTLIILQNDVEDPSKLEHVLKTSIQGSDNFKWIISPPIDLGRIDQIEDFLLGHQEHLAYAQLFIHTADKAQRYIPERVDYKDVIAQIIRRSSIPVIDELINQYSNANNPYVRILFSSLCALNRDTYRFANFGPYQMGKIIGDDLFKSTPVRKNSYSFILLSGAMLTIGERLTKYEEYHLLKSAGIPINESSEEEYYKKYENAESHVDSMDSSGQMFKIIWQAFQQQKVEAGKIYSIYGVSTPKFLGYKVNTLEVIEPTPYMFNPLEKAVIP